MTAEEKERFDEIKERLRILLENQITHFRFVASEKARDLRGKNQKFVSEK